MNKEIWFGDKNKNGQRVKIRGSQFVKREEKIKPKTVIRKPFNPFSGWGKKKP